MTMAPRERYSVGKGRQIIHAKLSTPVITVIGKVYWDAGHAPKDQGNRRKYLPLYALWEIHSVMALQVVHSVGVFGCLRRGLVQFKPGAHFL